MRVEVVHGRNLLCGGLIPNDKIKVGQTWAAADGSNHTVVITKADSEWVEYVWVENSIEKSHSKLAFAFQCRYCLVLDTPTILEGIVL